MRADRLLSLLMLLQSRGRMTARELAEQLEVSERTIYRDMEALGIAGIPVCAERGPGGGCFLIDGYQTKLTGLNEAEIRALFLFKMARPLADLGLSKALNDAMLKLSAALPVEQRSDAEQVRQRIHLDMEDWQQNAPSVPHLQTIQEAVWHDRKLYVKYPMRERRGFYRL
jgi:predicted DNA-binding transcriptional regulator YafY